MISRRKVIGLLTAVASTLITPRALGATKPPTKPKKKPSKKPAKKPAVKPTATSRTPSPTPTSVATGIVATSEIPVGGSKFVETTRFGVDVSVVVSHTPSGFIVFDAHCTHRGCLVSPNGPNLECPCHGSVFDAMTGNVVATPAPSPLRRFAAEVRDGSVNFI